MRSQVSFYVPNAHLQAAAHVKRMSNQIPILLQLLRREKDRLDWPSSDTDWQPFARACEDHQVAPFVFCQLKDRGHDVPPGLLEYLRRRYFEISARNYRLAKEAVDLALLLQEQGIAVLAYKGPAVAIAAYGDLALRQYQDIDLVIRHRDLRGALDLLVRRGFEITADSCRPDDPREVARSHEVTLAAPGKSYFVDLHWRLAPKQPRAFCPDVEKMWDRIETVQLPHGSVSTFCREDLFLALCCHGTGHQWCPLKWLLDIAEILRSPAGLDWDRIETMTFAQPLARASVSLAVLLAHDLLHAPMPDALPRVLAVTERTRSITSAIHTEILARGHTAGSNHTALLGLEGSISAWLDYLWVRYPRWFLEHAVVRIHSKDRAFVSLPQQLDFLYYIMRPIRLVGKHGTRLARLTVASRR
jgi:hypothetical protein